MITSSASRLTCTMARATVWRKVDTKSRSATASMLLTTTREKPRRAASAAVSIRYGMPAMAPEPSGRASASRGGLRQAGVSRRNAATCDNQ